MSDFQIRTVYCEPIPAACWIPYKGYTISLSTIPNHPEIGIWKDDESSDMHIIHDATADGIKEAFAYVDAQDCPSCGGLNTSHPRGCGRDPITGELNGSDLS